MKFPVSYKKALTNGPRSATIKGSAARFFDLPPRREGIMQTEHKHYFARIPTIFLLVLLGTIPWLAALLFLLRALD